MKRIFTLLALAAFTLPILAQSPDLMTYQAVLRDAENHLLTNQAVAVQISIIQGAPNNAAVYSEVHSLNTNANGLVSLMIGDGVSGDDFSLIDWSTGPYFLKTETDPAGGTNYTVTTTSQLLSVPYAKFADEAGNAFSGNYADLSGAPVDVSSFVNDAGYLTGITGTETAFDDWDKNELDDFSGNYADLSGAPTNVSAFANDAGYLSSELWSQNGSNLYYLGGRIGIGTSTPDYILNLHSGAEHTISMFRNTATGSSVADGLFFGIRTDFHAFLWNYEAGPLVFGTNGSQRMIIESGGDVGIGVSNPDARLQVVGDTKFGSNGVAFTELREITGTTTATGQSTQISYPSGYNQANTRVLVAEINFSGSGWSGLGSHYRAVPPNLVNQCVYLNSSEIVLFYPDEPEYRSVAYRILIMQIAP